MHAVLSRDVLDQTGKVDLDKLDLARRSLLAVDMTAEAGAVADAMLAIATLEALSLGGGQALTILGRALREELGRAAQAVPALRLVAGEGVDIG